MVKILKKYRTESYFPTYIRLSMASAECNQEFWRTQLGSLKFWRTQLGSLKFWVTSQ